MGKRMISNLITGIKDVLVYQPPDQPTPFVLVEPRTEKEEIDGEFFPSAAVTEGIRELEFMINYAKKLDAFMQKSSKDLRSKEKHEVVKKIKAEFEMIQTEWKEIKKHTIKNHSIDGMYNNTVISTDINENQSMLESIYQLPLNKDVVIRSITISDQPKIKVLIVFMDGLIDKKIINMTLLEPLMFMKNSKEHVQGEDFISFVMEECLPSGQASRIGSFKEVQQAINTGDAVVFFDGAGEAVTVETKGYEHRSIGNPTTEQSVRGSQNAFTEVLRVNTALIRTMLHASDLVTEMIPIGARGHSNCAVMYIKSIANEELVEEVKRRVNGISTDIITDSGILEHFIEDFPRNPFPQTLSTERPDRVAIHLSEGRVAIFIDGSPFGHILPVSFFTLMHSSDDFSLNLYYTNMLRLVRWFGALLSLLLPGLYLAISTFHQEAIPTELLLSIAAARAQVPFPTVVEILFMEFSFELIREGGLRIPGILGSTIGIVGALILGQTAVTAKIVSPIMVIVIALTGLASYSIPDYRLASAFRLSRFVFVLLAMSMGLIGVACGFLLFIAMLCSLKSFGMPYLAPLAPKTVNGGDTIFRSSSYHQKRRPDALNTKDEIRQKNTSRTWITDSSKGGNDHE
ncbi:spore germination protein [Pelosinus baikalensis]|uniref:Spore germination protein n=1 Tax=Pelosinus baikalensis TaxID=2892015 RepID=A0ABS8HXH3_9FIRM|nr:spore germination protein [Pelosinus baikalensis]MCC5466847.1 spore germination protein [Pelosinus baikalensis]